MRSNVESNEPASSDRPAGKPGLPVAVILVALLVALVFAIAARGEPVPNEIVYDDRLQSFSPDWNTASPGSITVAVSPDLDRRPISPLIFGANWGDGTPDAAQLATGFYTAARWGGNATTPGTWGDAAMESDEDGIQLRLRSLKELYDPEWASESWIALGTPDVVNLIPRMRAWRDEHCPEMKLALTEYKWGRDDTLSGALAQTEALAIFGREGIDMAMRWLAPESGSLTEDAYRLYRDYDGDGGQVAGDSVRAVSNDVDRA